MRGWKPLLVALAVATLSAAYAAAQDTGAGGPTPAPGCDAPYPSDFSSWTQEQRDTWTKMHCGGARDCPPPPRDSMNWTDAQKKDWLSQNCPRLLQYCDQFPPSDVWAAAATGDPNGVAKRWTEAHCKFPSEPYPTYPSSGPDCPNPPADSPGWTEAQKKEWLSRNCPAILQYCDSLPPPDAWRASSTPETGDDGAADTWAAQHCKFPYRTGTGYSCPPPPQGFENWTQQERDTWAWKNCPPPGCPPAPPGSETWTAEQRSQWMSQNCKMDAPPTSCQGTPPPESMNWTRAQHLRWEMANCEPKPCDVAPPPDADGWTPEQLGAWIGEHCYRYRDGSGPMPGTFNCRAPIPDGDARNWTLQQVYDWAVANCEPPRCDSPSPPWAAAIHRGLAQRAWQTWCQPKCASMNPPPAPDGRAEFVWTPCKPVATTTQNPATGGATNQSAQDLANKAANDLKNNGTIGNGTKDAAEKIVVPGFEPLAALAALGAVGLLLARRRR